MGGRELVGLTFDGDNGLTTSIDIVKGYANVIVPTGLPQDLVTTTLYHLHGVVFNVNFEAKVGDQVGFGKLEVAMTGGPKDRSSFHEHLSVVVGSFEEPCDQGLQSLVRSKLENVVQGFLNLDPLERESRYSQARRTQEARQSRGDDDG